MESNDKQWQVSEVELIYKPIVKASQRPKIESSRDCFNLLIASWDQNNIELFEQFKIILLNRANRVLGIVNISSGGTAATIADPKLIFGSALKAAAAAIVLAHNHPSGNLKASQADLDMTRKLKSGGMLLEVAVLDHLIITPTAYTSLSDDGMM